jgi:hypothetical protein
MREQRWISGGHLLQVAGMVLALALGALPVAADCTIQGPTEVSVDESFTLCGPSGTQYSYEWHGPGVPAGTYTRCITITGRTSGTYQYELTVWTNDRNPERCRRVVRVGGGAGGTMECTIEGPTTLRAGTTVELCGPRSSVHSYRWTGPAGFTATSRCVRVSRTGVYDLNVRNVVTGFVRECSHRLEALGDDGGASGECAITGPQSLPETGAARLCAQLISGASYRWTGPRSFQSTARCVNVSWPGTYAVTIRDLQGEWTRRCSFTLQDRGDDDGEDPDAPLGDNCPRALNFWRQACRDRGDVSLQELRELARDVDGRSRYFNWSDDVAGLCQALSPRGPMTRRKSVARQFAALLANVSAGSNGVTLSDGSQIGLDLQTSVQFRGTRTIAQLITQIDQLLLSQRGNFANAAQTLHEINSGRGIGRVCE